MSDGKSTSLRWERAKVLSLWMMIVLLAVNFGALFGDALTPSFNTVIQPGSMVGTAGYVAFTDGTSYFIKDGKTGAITSSGANAATILQSALTSSASAQKALVVLTGLYPLGSTGLSITVACWPTNVNWSVTFESGALLTYSGASYAITITQATRNCGEIYLDGPHIKATGTGGGIHLQSIVGWTIHNPQIETSATGIRLDNLNSGMIEGGYIRTPDTGRTPYFAGIDMNDSVGAVTYVQVSYVQIAGFYDGIRIGSTAFVAQEGILIQFVDFESNLHGVNLYRAIGNTIENCWFEQTAGDNVLISGNGGHPTTNLYMRGNAMGGSGVYLLHAANGTSLLYFSLSDTFLGSPGVIFIGTGSAIGSIDVTGSTGTIFNYGANVHLTELFDPQSGTAAIATSSTGVFSHTFSFSRAYPGVVPAMLPYIQISLSSLSDNSTRFGGFWYSGLSTTGVTLNLIITTAGGGGTFVTVGYVTELG